jgi:hypothetical protein
MLTLDNYIIIKLLKSNHRHITMDGFFYKFKFPPSIYLLARVWLENHFCFQQPSKMKGKMNW